MPPGMTNHYSAHAGIKREKMQQSPIDQVHKLLQTLKK